MKRIIRYSAIACCMSWSAAALAQGHPVPAGEDAEKNAFHTPTTGSPHQGEPAYVRDNHPVAGSQGPATNPEGKNITEPTGRPTKPSPNSPDK